MKVCCHFMTFSLLFAAMLLSACGSLPRPFMRAEKTVPNSLVERGIPADVAVNPVHGTSIPMSRLLTRSVIDEITLYDIVSYPNDRRVSYPNDRAASKYVLSGWVERGEGLPAAAPPRHIRWVLETRDGKEAGAHTIQINATSFEWEYGSPKIIHDVGKRTAQAIAKLMLGKTATVRSEAAQRSGIWVKPITDAPGDGNFSLTRAIGYALGDAGLMIVRDAGLAAHFLKGQVHIDSPESGQQKVEITWVVTDPEGREVGRARQRNQVPAGTFDERWGQSAVMISLAAVGGIRDILTARVNTSLKTGKQPLMPAPLMSGPNLKLVIPLPTLKPE